MNEIEKWSEYIEKYCSDENNPISDDLKEALIAKPVFLTRYVLYIFIKRFFYSFLRLLLFRTAHNLKQRFQDDEKKMDHLEIVDNIVCKFDVNSYKLKFEPNTESVMYRKNSMKMAKKVSLI